MNFGKPSNSRLPILIGAAAAIFGSQLSGQTYTRNFPVKWSYFQHTVGDTAALNGTAANPGSARWGINNDGSYPVGGVDASANMFTQLLGTGKVISGLNAGDYLLIKPSGNVRLDGTTSTAYESAGVFVDRSTVRIRTGYPNRFQGVANTLAVDSLRGITEFGGRNGTWSGEQSADQNTPNDFSLGMSNEQGVIVKIPSAGDLCFFHTINYNKFSTIERDGATLSFTKLTSDSQRPMFVADQPDASPGSPGLEINESAGSFKVRINRLNTSAFLTRVRWQIVLNGSATPSDFARLPSPDTDVIEMQPGALVAEIPEITLNNDNTHEGNEQFTIRLWVDPNDNPNEAFLAGNGDFPITIIDDDPVPNVYFSASPDANSGSFAGSTHTEPGSETPINIPIQLSRPSKFDTLVWYNHTPSDIGTVVSGVAAADGPDFVFNNLPENRGVTIRAGTTTGSIPIFLRPDNFYEGLEKIALHLGVDGSRGYTDRNWKPSVNGISGRHVITLNDSSPIPSASLSLMSANSIRRTRWNTNTSNLSLVKSYASSATPPAPLIDDTLTRLETTQTNPNLENYSQWLRGWIIAPQTGNYTFWIASDDYSEFWLSPDKNASGKTLRCSVSGATTTVEWTKYASQQSATIQLTAGQAYYFEAFHQESAGGDHLAVAWTRPGMAAGTREIIGGSALASSGDAAGAMASASEPDNGTGAKDRTILVSLSGASANSTTIPLVFGGTASLGSDYSVPASVPASSVTIPSGQTTVALPIRVMDDSLVEFDEVITVALASNPGGGYQAGSPSTLALTITDNDGGSHADQLLPRPEMPRPNGDGVIAMQLENVFPVAAWRIRGEPLWRMADDPNTAGREGAASGLAPGFHEIEFRNFDGYVSPTPMVVQVASSQTWTPPASSRPYYVKVDPNPPGTSLTVNLTGGIGGWKLDGETTWRASGTTFTGFPRGIYRVFYQPVASYALPAESVLSFSSAPVKTVSKTYVAEAVVSAGKIGVLADSLISDSPAESTVFVGRITSSAGYASGTAAQVNTVLTCAHVLFDDATLSFATNVRWHHQAQKNFYQPAATSASDYTGTVNTAGKRTYTSGVVPRGWLVLGGYAVKRLEYLEAGGAPGFATVESQNLDVGAAYFGQPVARGAKVGVLIREDIDAPGRWLQSGTPTVPVNKRLIGYPYENVPHDDLGKVFRRTYNLANSNYDLMTVVHSSDYVFNSYNIVAGGGMSGAPVMIERSTGSWSLCAIYLGANRGANYSVMREIGEDVGDLITQAQGRSGDGNTTGGGSYYVSNLTPDDYELNKGQVAFRSNVIGASWKILGGQSYKACAVGDRPGGVLDVSPEQQVAVEFAEIPNWRKPNILLVSAPAGGEMEYQTDYLAINYQAIQSQLASLGASAALQGPLADYDADGVGNLLEWAFNLDPARRDVATLVPVTGTQGLPSITTAGTGASRRLRVELVRMRADANPSLQYVVEFSSAITSDSWLADGIVLAVGQIDDNWERVVVEDSWEGRAARFARVKVIQN